MAKFTEEYQVLDATGNPVGPVQKFEAETEAELIQKLKTAHQNASARLYEVNRANRLGEMLTPDPEQPIRTFDEKPLTADEMVRIDNMMKDAKTRPEAIKLLIEAQLGGSLDDVRTLLRKNEIDGRVKFIQDQVTEFTNEHPEYPASDRDAEAIRKWLQKQKPPLAFTKKNFEIAFKQLLDDGIIILKSKEAPAAPPEPVATATPSPEAIPPAATTPTPENTGQDEVVRPSVSSSGLGRDNSSAAPTGTAQPKVLEITPQQIRNMSSVEYAKRMQDPEFQKAVEKLYSKK